MVYNQFCQSNLVAADPRKKNTALSTIQNIAIHCKLFEQISNSKEQLNRRVLNTFVMPIKENFGQSAG